ncbi:MAG: SEC59/DGK1/VTE5 family protein [Treponema sp.]|nr:SEC59/DGK1/VTE5 family protein [Treponema sp.]
MICPRVGIDQKKHLISLKKEFFRKTIHMCTGFIPLFLHLNKTITLILLCCALVCYSISELLRLRGIEIPLLSHITQAAARQRDNKGFVFGPVTLVLGIVLTAVLFDEQSARVGIFALAFGDGLASLGGKTFGKVRVPLTNGKTAAGSLTCFTAIFISSYMVTKNTGMALILAAAGTLIEGLPLKDYDNLLLPVLLAFMTGNLLPHV